MPLAEGASAMSSDTETAILHRPAANPRRDCITLKAGTRLDGLPARPELDPLRRVLSALADSLASTYRQLAAAGEISLDDVDVRVEAGLDLGTDGRSPAHPGHLRIDVRLRSRAEINALERLRLNAEQQDPVLVLLRQATPTRLEIAIDLRDTRSIAAE
jgi:hypothetical protein